MGWAPTTLRVLEGLSQPELGQFLRLYATELVTGAGSGERGRVGTMALPAFSCRYLVRNGVHLLPRFPFLAGTSYTVLVDRSLPIVVAGRRERSEIDEVEPLTLLRARPREAPTTRVAAIYPSAVEIPRNQLKLYVEFSAPMSEGFAGRHLTIRDAATQDPVADALFSTDPELWDPERRRLTVLFDPARLKRGLAPHRELGYALQEGGEIEVVVDAGFLDAAAQPLVAPTARRYRIGPDIRSRVDPSDWNCSFPARGTLDPIVVRFDRSLDSALLQHCLRVVEVDNGVLPGIATIDEGERGWSFAPRLPWGGGRYQLRIDAKLEDLAGNSLVRVFDRDLRRLDDAPPASSAVIEVALRERSPR